MMKIKIFKIIFKIWFVLSNATSNCERYAIKYKNLILNRKNKTFHNANKNFLFLSKMITFENF